MLAEPADHYGKVMSVPDDVMWIWFQGLTEIRTPELAALKAEVAEGRLHPKDAKRLLARVVVATFHHYDLAVVGAAQAAYDQTVAAYRQTVLTAFQDVEDNLAALRILEHETSQQDAAVQAAQRSLVLSLNQYKGGLVDYLQVLSAQTTALADQRTAVSILGRRTVATVQLIEAVGGGFDTNKLPTP